MFKSTKGAFKGLFKGDIFCTVIGTQGRAKEMSSVWNFPPLIVEYRGVTVRCFMSLQLSSVAVSVYDFTAFSTSLGTFTACHRGVDVIIILCIYCYRDPAVCRLLHQYSMSVRLYCIQCLQLSTLGGRSICESARLGSVQTRFRIPISIQTLQC